MNLINKYADLEVNEYYKNNFVTYLPLGISKVIVSINDQLHDNNELKSINVHNIINYSDGAYDIDKIYEVKKGFPGGFNDNRKSILKKATKFSTGSFKDIANAALLKEEIVSIGDNRIKVLFAYLNTHFMEELLSKGLRGIGVCGTGFTLPNKVLTMTDILYLWYEVKK